ncbi:MAG: Rrf2 family transcriptional regulator [Saprospiraceae bacterium]|nr:Rrf2 family transcriptional regulator [Saprospiraceae bacterium]MCB9309815.1 Rrf2 family transcriptional regulator [Lewinellaceae bacterium]
MLSKACQYAIKSLIYLAKHNDRAYIPLSEISKNINSPEAFTSKILQKLVSAKMVISTKGSRGGFQIINHEKILLGDIVEAIDGSNLSEGCFLGLPECSCQNPCPVHFKYVELKNKLNTFLFQISIDELVDIGSMVI